MRHAAQEAQHLVGLARGQHRGRLVEDQKVLVEIELLEDFELLLLARRQARHRHVERHLERHALEEFFQRRHLLAPVDHRRRVGAADHQVLGRGQRRHQREVLIDHADAVGVGDARIVDFDLVAVDHHLAAGRLVEAHDALDQRRLASAVLAEQRMHRAGVHLDRDIVERRQRPEDLGHADGFEADARLLARGSGGGAVMSTPRRRSWQCLDKRRSRDGAEHAALHLDHFQRRQMVADVGRRAAI